ncbi:MAG: hypothetical protein ACREVP_04900 [Burkholderiales bacterium]
MRPSLPRAPRVESRQAAKVGAHLRLEPGEPHQLWPAGAIGLGVMGMLLALLLSYYLF